MSEFDGTEEFVEALRDFTQLPIVDELSDNMPCPCCCQQHAEELNCDCVDDDLCADCDDAGLGACLEAADGGPVVESDACFCGFPDRSDNSLGHILAHNRDEVAGAVTVDWSAAHAVGGDHPIPHMFVVTDVVTGARLYPARITIMSDAAAHLAVVDITELINADGEPIRSTTKSKMGVHTSEYKVWNNADHNEGDVFLGDKYVTVVNRFVLASAQ